MTNPKPVEARIAEYETQLATGDLTVSQIDELRWRIARLREVRDILTRDACDEGKVVA